MEGERVERRISGRSVIFTLIPILNINLNICENKS
jgi:hypothetical protein